MSVRRSGESLFDFAVRSAWEAGHFWSAENPNGPNITQEDLPKLKPTDDVVIRAMISYAKSDATRYTKHVLQHHGRPPVFDGVVGPAIQAMVTDGERFCSVPDHAPPQGVVFAFEDPNLQQVVLKMQKDATLPALGTGSWKSCHGVGNFHSAVVKVNKSGMPAFLDPLFTKVLTRVQQSYAAIGLLWRFVDMLGVDLLTKQPVEGSSNTDMSFVSSSAGWIGLAIVGQNETCASNIWCKFLATYKGGSNDESIITQWTTLIKHELGHNTGRGHTNGGVMNPSIINGLPTLWGPEDPSTAWLKGQFGGVPVQIPGGPAPGPTPQPEPPVSSAELQKQIDELRLRMIVNEVTTKWLVNKVNTP